MRFLHATFDLLMKDRVLELEQLKKDPITIQEKTWRNLVREAEDTKWGKSHKYSEIKTLEDFQNNVPVSYYEDLEPYIKDIMNGEEDVLWPANIEWFSKSSGTTASRSKFIPVSKESLEGCHFKGGKDQLALYLKNNPESNILNGKSLFIGGSFSQVHSDPDIFCGDVSAVIMKNLPLWAEYFRTPRLNTALMSEWEEKIEKLAEESIKENVTSIAGVPTWTKVLIEKILEKTGAKNIYEVWPNLEVFFHGAVSFDPYRALFRELFPSKEMRYMEAYNASEGFFALEYDPKNHGGEMMLMPDYGIFYEFIPFDEIGKKHPKSYSMKDVSVGVNYALVISTNGGLWRYMIGDTVKFVSLFPHAIKITGRTKHFINAFGEEVMVHNTDQAVKEACDKTTSLIYEYTVAPIFMTDSARGGHEWIIEFEREPKSVEEFSKILDDTLRKVNSDYDAKRYKDIALAPPVIHIAPKGTFLSWMKSRGKLGGQNKVPRLSNSREYIDEILTLIHL